MNQPLSKVYVDQDGLLRLGEPEKRTSLITGGKIRVKWDDETKDLSYGLEWQHYERKCRGYLPSCKKQFRQDSLQYISFKKIEK